ncbi:hypothetical protein KKA27_01680 [Patescibacteria group bacterium]|nr:hypothetical protein [Patescibacteria group bacterium]MBU2633442.1 hypothetical protein [Patescibacteria group bacterium]
MKKESLVFDLKKNYLNMIEKSVGSSLYQNDWFINSKGESIDLCQNGRFSCAYFVSVVLHRFNLIDTIYVNVDSLERALRNCGWVLEEDPQGTENRGPVVIWEPRLGRDSKMHRHMGFWMGYGTCVSNDPEGNTPILHDPFFRDGFFDYDFRPIEKIYTHPLLIS